MLKCQHKICWFYERQGWAVTDEASERERENKRFSRRTAQRKQLYINCSSCAIDGGVCNCVVAQQANCCIATDFPWPISAKPCSVSCDLTHHTTQCFLSFSPVFVSQLQKGGKDPPPGCMFQYLQLSHSRRCLQNQSRSLGSCMEQIQCMLLDLYRTETTTIPLDLSGCQFSHSLISSTYYSSSPLGFCNL